LHNVFDCISKSTNVHNSLQENANRILPICTRRNFPCSSAALVMCDVCGLFSKRDLRHWILLFFPMDRKRIKIYYKGIQKLFSKVKTVKEQFFSERSILLFGRRSTPADQFLCYVYN
jgi:hypothetical protein